MFCLLFLCSAAQIKSLLLRASSLSLLFWERRRRGDPLCSLVSCQNPPLASETRLKTQAAGTAEREKERTAKFLDYALNKLLFATSLFLSLALLSSLSRG